MDIYDVSDCARPRFLTTFTFPGNIHNLTISPDGNRVYATLPLQVVDIHDPAHPVFLGNLEEDIPQPNVLQEAGLPVNYLAHEVLTSPGREHPVPGRADTAVSTGSRSSTSRVGRLARRRC